MMTYDKQMRQFYGDLVKEDGKAKRIYNEAGYLEFGAAGTAPVYYFHVMDYLGSTRAVIDKNSNQVQGTDYYTGGMPIAPYNSPMGAEEKLHTGKEFNAFSGLAWYDNAARGYDPITHRFLQQDPLAEKYPHLSPYASCANNSLKFVDPDGNRIVFAADCSQEFISSVNSIKDNLINNGLRDNIQRIENSEDFTLTIQSGADVFYSQKNTLEFDPTKGTLVGGQNIVSPATIFAHEMDHIAESHFNKSEFIKNSNTSDKQYHNKEEKRVITGTETEVAKKLGEIPQDGVTRTDHKAILTPTNSPTSNDVSIKGKIEIKNLNIDKTLIELK